MKLHAALCFLAFAGCATSSPLALNAAWEGGGGPGGRPQEGAEPLRLETPAGDFLVSPGHAEDFKKVLAGEPARIPFYADIDRR